MRGWIACGSVTFGLLGVGCYGGIDVVHLSAGVSAGEPTAGSADDGDEDDGSHDDSDGSGGDPPWSTAPLPADARRLSQSEVAQVLKDALDLELAAVANLPQDARTPFDNDATTQAPSLALVQGLYELSLAAGDAVTDDPGIVEEAADCALADGASCLEAIAATVGRRLLRRAMTDAEVGELAELGDAGLIVSTLVLDPEFVYRIERGDEEDGVVVLDGNSIATRMSFLIWGSIPDDDLLARGNDLRDAAVRTQETKRMLDDPRAVRQMQRLHAMWLGYDQLLTSDPTLAEPLRRETDALIERVLFDESLPWTDLLVFDETFVTPALAEHYGLDPVASPQWVPYGGDGRAGILSHGAYLSTGVNFGITSPTQRGKNVLELLLCRELPAVPPEVMVDEPPGTDSAEACKEDIWSMAKLEACQGCHLMIDSIGFGLEQYGAMGEFRTTEEDRPSCDARGDGSVSGLGEFSGPGELGQLLSESPEVTACFTRSFMQFALGRADVEDAQDLVDQLGDRFAESRDVAALVTTLVTDEAFAARSIEG